MMTTTTSAFDDSGQPPKNKNKDVSQGSSLDAVSTSPVKSGVKSNGGNEINAEHSNKQMAADVNDATIVIEAADTLASMMTKSKPSFSGNIAPGAMTSPVKSAGALTSPVKSAGAMISNALATSNTEPQNLGAPSMPAPTQATCPPQSLPHLLLQL
jgi:hypothetical protein